MSVVGIVVDAFFIRQESLHHDFIDLEKTPTPTEKSNFIFRQTLEPQNKAMFSRFLTSRGIIHSSLFLPLLIPLLLDQAMLIL